jgi:hypothetical protein
VTELIPFLLRYKIIQKTGAWYVIDNGEKFNGVEAVAKSLRENEKMRDELIERVKVEVNKRHTVVPEAPKSKAANKLAIIRKRGIR